MTQPSENLVSGIQPSGPENSVHLGQYFGALINWTRLQDEYHCYFSIADLHAITVTQPPERLKNNCLHLAALYLACGIDPDKNVIFLQSSVPQHAQLNWILNCYAGFGELSRMTQFKDKAQQHTKNVNCGLFTYPALMVADILLYDADVVPVGDDQSQHLELARNLAERCNHHWDKPIFKLPKTLKTASSRVMGLQNPEKKMSKSDANQNNNILMLDPPALIIKKVKRAVTDSGTTITNDIERPGIYNLLQLFSAATGETPEALCEQYFDGGYGKFKQACADAIVAVLEPIQIKYAEYRSDPSMLMNMLKKGSEQAQHQAESVLKKAENALGILT